MNAKSKQTSEQEGQKGRVKVDKLDAGKDTNDLTAGEQKRIVGGAGNVRRPRTGGDPEEEEDVQV